MKVLINKCYGGFSVTPEVIKRLVILEAKCIEKIAPKKYYGRESEWKKDFPNYLDMGGGFFAHKHEYNVYKDGFLYQLIDGYGDEKSKTRTDKDLISVFEELGSKKSSGMCAKLGVVEIPDGIDFVIEEYDGYESVAEKHRTWN